MSAAIAEQERIIWPVPALSRRRQRAVREWEFGNTDVNTAVISMTFPSPFRAAQTIRPFWLPERRWERLRADAEVVSEEVASEEAQQAAEARREVGDIIPWGPRPHALLYFRIHAATFRSRDIPHLAGGSGSTWYGGKRALYASARGISGLVETTDDDGAPMEYYTKGRRHSDFPRFHNGAHLLL